MERQRLRLWLRAGFFTLFVLAPPLDLLRLDLTQGRLIFLGQTATLGLDAVIAGEAGAGMAAFNILTRVLLPILLVVMGGGWLAWRYGRLYCGWLCPHFSVVEIINALFRRATGKPTLWERQPLPEALPDGRRIVPRPLYWGAVALGTGGFALLWAVVFLTYLLPPAEVYGNLVTGTLTRNQALFIGVATALLSVEFLFARHLFCRFACAVGFVQSLAWMGNPKALSVRFDRRRATECRGCNNACDHACPMRLRPRGAKRQIFTCTQCTRCIDSCDQVTGGRSLLHWVQGNPNRSGQ